MDIQPFEETKQIATQKWHEYAQAAKKNSAKVYQDLRKTYNQLRKGEKIIDIFKVIQAGGIHKNYHPKLAIAQATSKNVVCWYDKTGKILFADESRARWGNFAHTKHDVLINGCLPEIPKEIFPNTWTDALKLTAPLPIIPAHCLPDKITSDYYVLWEVDEWKPVAPVDPYLLRRITKNLFVVVAGWSLTELERAAMTGRMN